MGFVRSVVLHLFFYVRAGFFRRAFSFPTVRIPGIRSKKVFQSFFIVCQSKYLDISNFCLIRFFGTLNFPLSFWASFFDWGIIIRAVLSRSHPLCKAAKLAASKRGNWTLLFGIDIYFLARTILEQINFLQPRSNRQLCAFVHERNWLCSQLFYSVWTEATQNCLCILWYIKTDLLSQYQKVLLCDSWFAWIQ